MPEALTARTFDLRVDRRNSSTSAAALVRSSPRAQPATATGPQTVSASMASTLWPSVPGHSDGGTPRAKLSKYIRR